MPHPPWNERYASGEALPWDTGTPDPLLVDMIESRAIAPGRTLEIGCGTGTNAIYLGQHGFEVVGVDISPLAVEAARAKAHGRCRFETAAPKDHGVTPARRDAVRARSWPRL